MPAGSPSQFPIWRCSHTLSLQASTDQLDAFLNAAPCLLLCAWRCVPGGACTAISRLDRVGAVVAQARDCAVTRESRSVWRRVLGHHTTLRTPRDGADCTVKVPAPPP